MIDALCWRGPARKKLSRVFVLYPLANSAATMNLRQALRAASVRRVIVLRHGNTHKAEVDAERQLTDKGSRQCDLFREHYADRLSLVHSRRHGHHSHGHHRQHC